MARLVSLCLLLVSLSACKTSQSARVLSESENQAASPPNSPSEGNDQDWCAEASHDCPITTQQLPFQCRVYALNNRVLEQQERLSAFGPSLCEAKKRLKENLCQVNRTVDLNTGIECAPDSTAGSCTNQESDCPETGEATRCVAKRYQKEALALTQRLGAWGENSCKARDRLNKVACSQGLNPSLLSDIECEPERNRTFCPPSHRSCSGEKLVPSYCQVSTLGDGKLDSPLLIIAPSVCEAEQKLLAVLCLQDKSAKILTLAPLASMECRSLVGNR